MHIKVVRQNGGQLRQISWIFKTSVSNSDIDEHSLRYILDHGRPSNWTKQTKIITWSVIRQHPRVRTNATRKERFLKERHGMIGLISLVWQQRSTFGIVHYLNTNWPSSRTLSCFLTSLFHFLLFNFLSLFFFVDIYIHFTAAAWLMEDWDKSQQSEELIWESYEEWVSCRVVCCMRSERVMLDDLHHATPLIC